LELPHGCDTLEAQTRLAAPPLVRLLAQLPFRLSLRLFWRFQTATNNKAPGRGEARQGTRRGWPIPQPSLTERTDAPECVVLTVPAPPRRCGLVSRPTHSWRAQVFSLNGRGCPNTTLLVDQAASTTLPAWRSLFFRRFKLRYLRQVAQASQAIHLQELLRRGIEHGPAQRVVTAGGADQAPVQ
jgi:hypothetical protein